MCVNWIRFKAFKIEITCMKSICSFCLDTSGRGSTSLYVTRQGWHTSLYATRHPIWPNTSCLKPAGTLDAALDKLDLYCIPKHVLKNFHRVKATGNDFVYYWKNLKAFRFSYKKIVRPNSVKNTFIQHVSLHIVHF